jgi:general secretion pathway protein C
MLLNHNRRMWMDMQGKWALRLLTFGVWALAAASIAFWGLRFMASQSLTVAAPAPASTTVAADPQSVAKLLGAGLVAAVAGAPAVSAPSRVALLGVIAARSSAGTALIAVDGKPARPYRVGSQVDEGLVLQSVAPRKAVLGPAGSTAGAITLELPALRK